MFVYVNPRASAIGVKFDYLAFIEWISAFY